MATTLPLFIFVRWGLADSFWLIPYHKKMTEEQIKKTIAKQVESLIDDMLLFDEHQKKLSSKIAAKRIINHAEETNRKFWEVWYESPCSFDIDNLKLRCSEGPTFDSATDDAKKELKWCELTRCY